MSDKSFRTTVVGLLAIQLLVFFMIFNELNSGIDVWVNNPVYKVEVKNNVRCGTNDNPCVVQSRYPSFGESVQF